MSDGSTFEGNKDALNEDYKKTETEEKQINANVHTLPKSFGIRRSEILMDQYNLILFRVIFLFSVFLVSYAYSLDATVRATYQNVATDSYLQSPLISTVNVIRSVIAAAAQPTYARLSDTFGRLELFLVSIIFYAMGTVIESQAYDIMRFCGGVVLYQVGYSGVIVLLQIVLADFSTLNWRLLCSFIPATPFIINTWVSGDVADAALKSYSWNFCIGMWAFIFPLACIPFVCCMFLMHWKARQTVEWREVAEEERRIETWISWKDNPIVTFFWQIDVIGVLFMIVILGFILVPLTIAGGVTDKWRKASTIAPLVIGFCLIFPFIFWEYKFAKHPVFPLPLMRDRGVWSALMIAIFIDFVYYMPNDYMYYVLVVAMRASVKAATRIGSLYSFVSVITGPLFGIFIAILSTKYRRLKGFIIFGVACWFIAAGILVHYRGDNDGVNSEKYKDGVIGALCLMGFGAGFFTYSTQVSISTCTDHEHMAVIIALYLSFYNVGAAIGASVSGAVYTNVLYQKILDEFRKSNLDTSLAQSAYLAPLAFIEEYVWGTPERIAVVLAYAHLQRILCIIGLVLCVPLLIFTFFLRDHPLESVQSLEEAHDEGMIAKGDVIVNNYDEDVILKPFKKLFKK